MPAQAQILEFTESRGLPAQLAGGLESFIVQLVRSGAVPAQSPRWTESWRTGRPSA